MTEARNRLFEGLNLCVYIGHEAVCDDDSQGEQLVRASYSLLCSVFLITFIENLSLLIFELL